MAESPKIYLTQIKKFQNAVNEACFHFKHALPHENDRGNRKYRRHEQQSAEKLISLGLNVNQNSDKERNDDEQRDRKYDKYQCIFQSAEKVRAIGKVLAE